MKVMLLTDVKGQGNKGQVLVVNDGYARNYLLPKKLAVEANNAVINEVEQKKFSISHKQDLEKKAAQELALKLRDTGITIKVKAGEGKIYGSVTSKEIAEALSKQGIQIEKKQVMLKEIIKTLGEHQIEAKLYPGISAKFILYIEKE